MLEFKLDHGSPDAAHCYAALCEFTRGYIEALFFTNTGSCDDAELEHATVHDLAPEAWESILKDCSAFQAEAAGLLTDAIERQNYSLEQAGNDFWFTRNGHGVGYWDRTTLDAGGIGDKMTDIASEFASRDVMLGDDGKVYLA